MMASRPMHVGLGVGLVLAIVLAGGARSSRFSFAEGRPGNIIRNARPGRVQPGALSDTRANARGNRSGSEGAVADGPGMRAGTRYPLPICPPGTTGNSDYCWWTLAQTGQTVSWKGGSGSIASLGP